MCRLLYIRAQNEFEISYHLKKLADISKNSKEYQGHGWGCAYLQDNDWKLYKNIRPIWEDNLEQFNQTSVLVAHTRSAFQDKDIGIENNMPFCDNKYIFIFNGELRGVKIKEDGRIGAEKIFNYIKRFDNGDMLAALTRGVGIILKRTEHIRALNIIIVDMQRAYVASIFNEDPEYFTLRSKTNGAVMICSEPYSGESNWQRISNHTIRAF